MKKCIYSIIAIALALITLAASPLQALAESQEIYISDIRMASAEDADDAKSELEDAGYTVVEQDLNPKTKEDFVYIGYKTTSDPNEAITDIKAIKQEDGYTIFDAEDIMAELNGEALEDAIYLMKIIREFRNNYASGQKLATHIYTLLQNYRYSDTVLMGDFILDPKLTENDLTNVVLLASPKMNNGLYQFLGAGLIPDSYETCFTRLAEMEEGDYEVTGALKSAARLLLNAVKSYRSYVVKEVNTSVAELDNNMEEESEGFNTDVMMSANLLAEYEIDSVNLFDFFMDEEITAKDLYPLAACMTDAEVQALRFLGVATFINLTVWGDDYLTDNFLEIDNGGEKIDFWLNSAKTGMKRIAVTNDVMQQMILGKTESLGQMMLSTENVLAVAGVAMCGIASFITAGVRAARLEVLVAAKDVEEAYTVVFNFARQKWHMKNIFTAFNKSYRCLSACVKGGTVFRLSTGAYIKNMSAAAQKALSKLTADGLRSATNAVTKVSSLVRGTTIAMTVSIVLTIAVVVVTIALFIVDLVNYYSDDYSEFPAAVLSQETLPDGSVGYVTYNAVMDGDRVGDTNAREGRKWNALYFTNSKSMGVPIRASSLYGSHDGNVNGYVPVTQFGYNTAFDLNTNTYTHDTGMYLYFARVDENTLASIFTRNSVWFISGAALIVVAAAVTVLIVVKNKKKKTAASVTAETDAQTTHDSQ